MSRSAPAAPPQGWHADDRGFTGGRGGGGGPSVFVDPDRPRTGLVVDGQSSAGTILGLDIDAAAADHWVRGDDLTAVYEPADARRLRATAMWRCLPPIDLAVRGAVRNADQVSAWMLVASAQTALLDSDPRLDVVSRAPGRVILWGRSGDRGVGWGNVPAAGSHAVLVRGPADRSILVAVHPADFQALDATAATGGTVIRCGLFGESLEKGVLLRGRALGAIGPTTGDEAWAGRLIDQFVAAPPPLTT